MLAPIVLKLGTLLLHINVHQHNKFQRSVPRRSRTVIDQSLKTPFCSFTRKVYVSDHRVRLNVSRLPEGALCSSLETWLE